MAASYQTTVEPTGDVAAAVSVCIGVASHSVTSPPLVGANGKALIVIVPIAFKTIPQPPFKGIE